jgi:CO/xanthine dehydrogenase FAD-binding subunit
MAVLFPTSCDEALDLLGAAPEATVLAGGTDLMVAVNEGRRRLSRVIALRDVAELRAFRREQHELVLGAGMTFARLMAPEIAAWSPALASAARTVGSPQIRNAGTIGGNLGTASPAGDTLPVLQALGASVTIASADSGEARVEPIDEFIVGPKLSRLAPTELITAVRVPIRRGPQVYLKVGVRNAMVIAVASVALAIDLDRQTVGVGLGSVGPRPLDAPAASAWLERHVHWSPERVALRDDAVPEEFARLVADATRPIDDHRGRSAYRRHAVEVLARRALRRCVDG